MRYKILVGKDEISVGCTTFSSSDIKLAIRAMSKKKPSTLNLQGYDTAFFPNAGITEYCSACAPDIGKASYKEVQKTGLGCMTKIMTAKQFERIIERYNKKRG